MTAASSVSPLFSAPASPAKTTAPVSPNAIPHLQYLSIAGELLLLDITPVERMIMGFVLSLEKSNRRCFATNAYFANLCNVSASTSQRAVRHLVQRGLLRHFLSHQSGTQRLLAVNTAQIDAEVNIALEYTARQTAQGRPPKQMLAPLVRPKTSNGETGATTATVMDPVPPPMTLEEEYLFRQMEKDLVYCRAMSASVSAVVHHLEGQQAAGLERVEALLQEQMRVAEICMAETRLAEEETHPSLPLEQAPVLPTVPNSEIIESEITTIPTPEPVSGDVCPPIQPIATPVQRSPRQSDEAPQQPDEAPRQFDDPIYNQFHREKSLYKKQQDGQNKEPASKVCSDILPEETGKEKHGVPDCTEAAAGIGTSDTVSTPTSGNAPESSNAPTSGNALLNSIQTTLATLRARAKERLKTAAQPSPSPTRPTSPHGYAQQQPYPKYTKPQPPYGTPQGNPTGTPQKPQTFYQQQGQQNDEARRGVMTFQELPHGAMFVWEGAANAYGILRKVDDDHALRVESNKIIRVGNLQGRVERQRR